VSLQNRIRVTLGLFSGDYATMNEATASRLNLWSTAVKIIHEHWFNGVGPRGYRYVYTQYSAKDDPFHADGQTHPHQLVLEVLAETGLIGLGGLGVFCVVGFRFLRENALGLVLFPWYLGVIAATFPLNTHMAFYGSYWSSLIWWLILLVLAGATVELARREPLLI
jgi:O-antigen ligase